MRPSVRGVSLEHRTVPGSVGSWWHPLPMVRSEPDARNEADIEILPPPDSGRDGNERLKT